MRRRKKNENPNWTAEFIAAVRRQQKTLNNRFYLTEIQNRILISRLTEEVAQVVGNKKRLHIDFVDSVSILRQHSNANRKSLYQLKTRFLDIGIFKLKQMSSLSHKKICGQHQTSTCRAFCPNVFFFSCFRQPSTLFFLESFQSSKGISDFSTIFQVHLKTRGSDGVRGPSMFELVVFPWAPKPSIAIMVVYCI